ncbi:MAG: tetratricopeptide repeat protein [Bdellovibrionales bacterium]
MKNLLLGAIVPVFITATACSTVGQKDGGAYRDSALSNQNPAPKNLSPPDYSPAAPTMDDAYLSSQADYHFTMGETLSFEGQSARAIEEFKTTLIYDPKSVHVRLRLAAEYVRLGTITEAVEQGEIAVDMAPHDIEARMLLGGLYSGLKMFDPARNQFAEILKLNPEHAEAAIYMGALLAEQKKYDESIKYFEDLAKNENFKDSEKAYYYIGRVRSEQGSEHYAEAEKAFGKALAVKADYPEATTALAMFLRAQNKEKQMETLLKSYQEKFGPDHEMARQLSHYYLEAENFDKALEQLEVVDSFERDNLNIKIQIALILIEQKKYEQAAVRLEDVLQQAPESDKVRYYLGAVYEEINRPELAVLHYKKIPAASTYFSEAVVHSAHMLKTAGNMDGAIELVEKAIKESDDVPQLFAYYATLLDENKNYKKAAAMLTAAVEKYPTNTQLRFFLGTMQDRLGNTKETIAQMNKVIEQDKDHVQALNYLAYTYAELGKNLDDATALATHALELQPNDGYILDTIGWIHFKKGEVEEAIKYLEAAHKAKSDEAIIAEHLGDAYLRHQMWQKAQKMYMRAAELERDTDHNRKIMEKIANVQTQVQQGPGSRSPASISH